MLRLLKHLMLITHHRWLMFRYCLKIRLIKAALFHDLSKFSLSELAVFCYYNGTSSPISKERLIKGYSLCYLHHCARNKHHFEYWLDMRSSGINRIRIPFKYLAETALDMIAAGKVYSRKKWTKEQPYNYWTNSINQIYFHPASRQFLEQVFLYLQQHGLAKTLKRQLLFKIYQQTNDDQPDISLLNIDQSEIKK